MLRALPFDIVVTRLIDNLIDTCLSLWIYISILGIIHITETTLHKKNILSFKQAFKFGLSNWLRLVSTILVFVLQGMLIIIPLAVVKVTNSNFLFNLFGWIGIIVIILFIGFYLFFPQVIVIYGIKNNNALRRSSWTVKGQWWQAVGHSLAILLPITVISYGFFYLLRWAIPGEFALQMILNSVVAVFLFPVSTIYQTLLFLRLEARKTELAVLEPAEPNEARVPESDQLPG